MYTVKLQYIISSKYKIIQLNLYFPIYASLKFDVCIYIRNTTTKQLHTIDNRLLLL